MALARKCDRCKKLFEPNLSSNGHTNAHHNVYITINSNKAILEQIYNFDLCPECYEELRAWMEMEVNND